MLARDHQHCKSGITEHIRVLDGLRAIAILLILSLHIVDNLYLRTGADFLPLNSQAFTWFLMNGWVGVHLFFVLSGFLITRQLRDLEKPHASRRTIIRRFLRHRIYRIVPAYYFMLALIFITILVKNYPLSANGTAHFISEALAYLSFTQDIYPSRIGEAFVFWSLATELKFYLLAPLIVLCLSKTHPHKRYAIMAASLLLLLGLKIVLFVNTGATENYLSYFMEIRRPFYMAIDSLAAGVLCQYLWSDRRLNIFFRKRIVSTTLFYAGTFLMIFLMSFTKPYWHESEGGLSFFSHSFIFTLIAVGFSAMLLGLLGNPPGYRFFESSALRFIALISYSLYLLHTFLVPVSIQVTIKLAGDAASAFEMWLYGFLILLFVSSLPAFLLYHLIEKPFIARSKR